MWVLSFPTTLSGSNLATWEKSAISLKNTQGNNNEGKCTVLVRIIIY